MSTDASAWQSVSGALRPGVPVRYQAASNDMFRVRASNFVSGSATYTMDIGDTVLEARYDANNALMYLITRNAIYTPKDIITDGSISSEGVTLGQSVLNHGTVVSASKALDTDASRVHQLILGTANVDLSFGTTAAPGVFRSILVFITQGSGGLKTVSYPANVRWQGGFSPSLSTAEGATDILQIMTVDGGATWVAGITYQVAAL